MAEIKFPEMCPGCDGPISDHTVKGLKFCRDGLLKESRKMLEASKLLDALYIKEFKERLMEEPYAKDN